MADFFDKVLVGINKGVSSVSEGSKNMMEKAKINTSISDAEKEKKRIAEQLGIIVYDLHQNGEVLPEAVLAFCDQITEINNQIATLRQKLTAMEMPKETPTSAPAAGGFCPNCGSPVREGAKFCGKCGNAM